MKAAVLVAKRTIETKEVPTPTPAAGEVLVRVFYCGVCGSDIPRYLDGAVHFYPLILGHEFSGQVVEVGEGVDAALVGQRVSGVPLVPCMECADCKAGNYSLCKHYTFIGSSLNGAYAQYVTVPVRCVFPIGDDVPDFEAAFFEPAAVAQHAVNLVDIKPGTTAAVAGCGTIGIFVAQILQSMGVEVTALARRDVRIQAARSAGVKNLVNTAVDGWDEPLMPSATNHGFDYVFDTSGNTQMMVKSFDLVANKGTIMMVGTPKREMTFTVKQWENLNRREMKVTGSWMSYSAPWPGGEWKRVAESFARGVLRVTDEMIDSVYTLDEIGGGLEKFATPNSIMGKVVINCQ